MDNSLTKIERIQAHYDRFGFAVVEQFLPSEQVIDVLKVINQFHQLWCKDNQTIYQNHAINSADLTSKAYLNNNQRKTLFELIASHDLHQSIEGIFNGGYGFMNTQLFFDPVKPDRKNYWHRDPQWHLSLEQQQNSLEHDTVLHCRLALKDEPGIEVIPGSHKQWDTPRQLDTRLGTNHCQVHDDLPEGKTVPLKAGDMLIFSGNMIHRGLYGKDRMALDLLFCDDKPELLKWVNPDCLPEPELLERLDCPSIFSRSAEYAQRRT